MKGASVLASGCGPIARFAGSGFVGLSAGAPDHNADQHMPPAPGRHSRLGLWLSGFLNLARGDSHDMDRVADYIERGASRLLVKAASPVAVATGTVDP
jgi:hypothetical protein